MIDRLPADVQAELDRLGQQFGSPLVREIDLQASGHFAPLGKPDRYAEVCMVVQRPDGTLITARKDYYPPGVFRLLTGGIGYGEPILTALLRETAEETSLSVSVVRFLAAISYRMPGGAAAEFHTFAFLLQEQAGTLHASDPTERVAEFRMVASHELPGLAAVLEGLAGHDQHEIQGSWHDWGRFRAIAHRLLAPLLP